MASRFIACFWVIVAGAIAWFIMLAWAPPGPAAIVVGAVALIVCLLIMIVGTSLEAWEGFWDRVAESMWWW